MIHASFTDFRKRLAHFMDRAHQDHDAILITRQGSEPVVMLAQSDYDSLLETLRLRSSPINAARLDEAIATYDAGGGFDVVWDDRAGAFRRP